jgi:hypothetical protein
MPATQGYRLEDWHEPPALTASHELTTPPAEVFVNSHEQCVEFVLLQGLKEIDDYQGYPDFQIEVAEEISRKIFAPEIDVMNALHKYLSSVNSIDEDQAEVVDSVPLAELIELRTEYVVMRYDPETRQPLPFVKQG